MAFDAEKKNAMKKLDEAMKSGEADEPALPLLDAINVKKDYFTSSSCYGRIMLLKFSGKKERSNFIARWHRLVTCGEVKKELDKADGLVWLRMEPLILHISCRNVTAAEKVLSIKDKLGVKRGGIFSISKDRVQIELEGTQRVEAMLKDNGKIMVDDEYIKKIVGIANERFGKNAETWEKLNQAFTQL